MAWTEPTEKILKGWAADMIYVNVARMDEGSGRVPKKTVVEYVDETTGAIKKKVEYINPVRAELTFIHSIIHEAAHVADHLLDSQRMENAPSPSLWENPPRGAMALASETVTKNRLKKGFRQEWERTHHSFVERGVAIDYDEDQETVYLGDEGPAHAGFMTSYGSKNAGEDIGEMTAGVLMRAFIEDRNPVAAAEYPDYIEDFACNALRKRQAPGVPGNLAAVFTKVGFLQSAGFITDQAYEECVGKLKIRGKGSGFFTIEAGQEVKQYTQKVEGRIGRKGEKGPWFLEVEAKGTIGIENKGTKPARIRLTLETSPASDRKQVVPFPRGLYRIGPGSSVSNTLQIFYSDSGEEKIGIEVTEADILISRASHKLVEGAVFIKKYRNYTELLKRLEQTPKKELIITFRKKN